MWGLSFRAAQIGAGGVLGGVVNVNRTNLRAAWEDNLTARSFYPDEIKDDVQVIPVDTVIDLILDAGVTTAPGGVDDPA